MGVEEKFDAVFSNAAMHWCKANPVGVLMSARKVLKPGGRFVAEMGGFTNCIGEYRFLNIFAYIWLMFPFCLGGRSERCATPRHTGEGTRSNGP